MHEGILWIQYQRFYDFYESLDFQMSYLRDTTLCQFGYTMDFIAHGPRPKN